MYDELVSAVIKRLCVLGVDVESNYPIDIIPRTHNLRGIYRKLHMVISGKASECLL